MQTIARPATAKQFAFLKTLVEERDWESNEELAGRILLARATWRSLSTKDVSGLIDSLMDQPRKTNSVKPVADLKAGVYTDGTNFVRVYHGQQSGKMLCKTIMHTNLDGVTYTYAGAASKVITANFRRMTLEEVGGLGKAWDHCLMCGRRLDDPESVDRGIGPVCAKKY